MGGERVSVQPILQRQVPLTGDRVSRFVSYTFVAALPEMLLEYLESPTPYLMGVLSDLPDVDAVMVDLDIGEVRLPTNSELPELPSPFRERLVIRLQMVLSPELATADLAIPAALPPPLEPHLLDKEIRACFVLFFSELLYGYRSCLEVVRLHRHPLIVFHKAAFMGMRRLNSPLLHELIEGQMFQLFVTNRGLPFRECDIFDEVVCSATMENYDLGSDEEKQRMTMIRDSLLMNEKQERIMTTTPQNLSRKISLCVLNGDKPGDGDPRSLDNDKIDALIEDNRLQWNLDDPGRIQPKVGDRVIVFTVFASVDP
ncbi:unnamed protein product [Heligmosomoides polygyrus]|uniref:UDENN domain-containing protein n=1 Tax=Heligmosomoides polygyrus TaxID=6339 RepID=A0A3P8BB73_HELPZ|nr:unnamed protein product [Heligmosomoides polygyrus]